MKNLVLTVLLAGCVTAPASAQLLSPESVSGAIFGGLTGAVLGGNCHELSGEGAAIGAGAGFIFGALVGHANRRAEQAYYANAQPVSYVPQNGYGYVAVAAPGPVYVVRPARPNHIVGVPVVGAATVIGTPPHAFKQAQRLGPPSRPVRSACPTRLAYRTHRLFDF